MSARTELTGAYFPYCQFCKHDGNCELKHHEFLGAPSVGQIVKPGFNHEALDSLMTAFQTRNIKSGCRGRVLATGSLYYPLQCECGTVVNSLNFLGGHMCSKFSPNEKGSEREKLAKEIAIEKNIDLSEVTPDDLPEFDENYRATMRY